MEVLREVPLAATSALVLALGVLGTSGFARGETRPVDPDGGEEEVTGVAAAPRGPETDANPDHDGDDPECDRLFGTVEDQEQNQTERTKRLILVEEGPSYIDVVQTGGFGEPTEIAYRGLTLRETTTNEDGEPVAVFEVDEELGFCEAGEYEVEVDDSLGAEGRILAILPELVLVQHGDALRYLRSADLRGRPTFKVSWRSPFSIVVESEGSKGSSRSKRAVRRRRRRR